MSPTEVEPVAIVGADHLGLVMAGVLASHGVDVSLFDEDPSRLDLLRSGVLPVIEPGLQERIDSTAAAGRLRVVDPLAALASHRLVWIAKDTPLTGHGTANSSQVVGVAESLLDIVAPQTLIVLSSQLPVGTTASLERAAATRATSKCLSFACVPENLRRGTALADFEHAPSVVIGARTAEIAIRLRRILAVLPATALTMGVESAEMTKHALNTYLATTVAFANETAALCSLVGADYREVEQGLRSDRRVGRHAYLGAGPTLGPGPLLREVLQLLQLGRKVGRPTPLLEGVLIANQIAEGWVREALEKALGQLSGRIVAIWGLASKPATDAFADSVAIRLSATLQRAGATVRVHDPALERVRGNILDGIDRVQAPLATLPGADALVIAGTQAMYEQLPIQEIKAALSGDVIVDVTGDAETWWGLNHGLHYLALGRPE